jgi:hypothetical protein
MVKSLDMATQDAIRDRSRVIYRDFVLFTVKDGEGDPVNFGFTTYGEDVTLNIEDGLTGETVSRTYLGDGAPLQDIEPIPQRIGLEIINIRVTLNPIHAGVQSMFRGHDCRNAPVQVHRIYLDDDTMLPVANPKCRFLGFVNTAPENRGGAGGTSRLDFGLVSRVRELTRTNPAKRSDEQQRLRSGDRFRRYNGVTRPVFWGEAQARD